MNLIFHLDSIDIELTLPAHADFKNQLLMQNGYFGLKPNASNTDIATAAVKNYTPIIERTLKYLPRSSAITILDIGSGNSIVDLALAKLYPNAKFILLDGDEWNDNPVLHSTNFKPYNHWVHVTDSINLNKLDPARFDFVGLDYDFNNSVQYVLSYGSCGLHYPVDTYINQIYKALDIGGIVAIGPILNIKSQLQTINNLFTPLEIFELDNFISRERNQMTTWTGYFPNDFKGPFAHAGVWQKQTPPRI